MGEVLLGVCCYCVPPPWSFLSVVLVHSLLYFVSRIVRQSSWIQVRRSTEYQKAFRPICCNHDFIRSLFLLLLSLGVLSNVVEELENFTDYGVCLITFMETEFQLERPHGDTTFGDNYKARRSDPTDAFVDERILSLHS